MTSAQRAGRGRFVHGGDRGPQATPAPGATAGGTIPRVVRPQGAARLAERRGPNSAGNPERQKSVAVGPEVSGVAPHELGVGLEKGDLGGAQVPCLWART